MPHPTDLQLDWKAFVAALKKFKHDYPTLNIKLPTTEILILAYVAHSYPELLDYMDWELGEEGYAKPSELVREYDEGMPLSKVARFAYTPLEKWSRKVLQ